jgi:hypothetical protein
MKTQMMTLTPSEFMSGYLLGDYGKNHLIGDDRVTELLRELAVEEVHNEAKPVRIRRPSITLTIAPAAISWAELLRISEHQVLSDIPVVDVMTYLIKHHFETTLVAPTQNAGPLLNLFDFMVERLLGLEKANQLKWDNGRVH